MSLFTLNDERTKKEELREMLDVHRKALMLAIRSLPREEVLELVAAGIVSRGDYDPVDVAVFMKEVNDWSWGYAQA